MTAPFDKLPEDLALLRVSLEKLPMRTLSPEANLPVNLVDALMQNSLFSSCPVQVIEELASCMKCRFYQPGDIILKEKETGNSMFFILKGMVQVHCDRIDSVLAELPAGRFFGEIGLLFKIPRTAHVIAKSKCFLASLGHQDFQQVLKHYSDIAYVVLQEGRNRYLEMQDKRRKSVVSPSLSLEFVQQFIAKIPSFKELSSEVIEKIAQDSVVCDWNVDDLIFHNFDDPQVIFVESGQICVYESDDKVYREISIGSHFSTFELFVDNGGYRFAKATQKTTAICIPSFIASTYLPKSFSGDIDEANFIARSKSFGISKRSLVHSESLPKEQEQGIFSWSNEISEPKGGLSLFLSNQNQKRRPSVAVWADPSLLKFAESRTSPSECAIKQNTTVSIFSSSSSDLVNLGGLGRKSIVRILSFLDIKNLMNCSLVCKEWRNCSFDNSLANSVDLFPFHKSMNKGIVLKVAKFASSRLQTLSLKDCWSINDECIQSISSFIPNLKELDLSSCWDITCIGLNALLSNCHYISSINFSNCRKIDDSCIALLAEKCYMLDQLSFSYCKNLTNDALLHLSRFSETISKLDFHRCTGITDEGFLKAFAGSVWPRLNYINLTDCTFLSDVVLKTIGAAAPKLETLFLSFCCSLTETAMSYISLFMPQLVSLDLSYCGGAVTDFTVELLISNLKNLSVLSLRGCIQITSKCLDVLHERGTKLSVLNVSSCKNITNDVILRYQYKVPWTWTDKIDSFHSRQFTC